MDHGTNLSGERRVELRTGNLEQVSMQIDPKSRIVPMLPLIGTQRPSTRSAPFLKALIS